MSKYMDTEISTNLEVVTEHVVRVTKLMKDSAVKEIAPLSPYYPVSLYDGKATSVSNRPVFGAVMHYSGVAGTIENGDVVPTNLVVAYIGGPFWFEAVKAPEDGDIAVISKDPNKISFRPPDLEEKRNVVVVSYNRENARALVLFTG